MEEDFFNLTGSCTFNLPYPTGQLQTIRNNVSVANNKKAMAQASKDAAYKDWADCKRKLFCNASKKNGRLNDRENELRTATLAVESAEKDLKQAEAANRQEQGIYDKCRADEIKREEAERKAREAEKIAEAEEKKRQQQIELEEIKVSSVNLENGKDYMLYGVIGLGIVSAIIVGFLAIKA